jgi:hypothetical protein
VAFFFLILREESVAKLEDSIDAYNYEVYTLRAAESQVRRNLQVLRFFILLIESWESAIEMLVGHETWFKTVAAACSVRKKIQYVPGTSETPSAPLTTTFCVMVLVGMLYTAAVQIAPM